MGVGWGEGEWGKGVVGWVGTENEWVGWMIWENGKWMERVVRWVGRVVGWVESSCVSTVIVRGRHLPRRGRGLRIKSFLWVWDYEN